MASTGELKALCYDGGGALKTKPECRTAPLTISSSRMLDVMDAEDLTDKTLRELNLWPESPDDEKPSE